MQDNCSPESWLTETVCVVEELVNESRRLLSKIDFPKLSPAVVESSKDKIRLVQSILDIAKMELTSLINEFKPVAIPWLPTDESAFNNMTFLSGCTPWSFFLTYSFPPRVDFSDCSWNTLQQFSKARRCGEVFVCCKSEEGWFRGIFICDLPDDRVKVVDIDSNETHIKPRYCVFHLPEELCEPHALAMHCALMEDVPGIVRHFWSEDLEGLFRGALETQSLRSSDTKSLRIKVLKTLPSSPPKYVVKVVIQRADGQVTNLSDWFLYDFIPGLMEVAPSLSEKYEVIYFVQEWCIEALSVIIARRGNETCLPDSGPTSAHSVNPSLSSRRELATVQLPKVGEYLSVLVNRVEYDLSFYVVFEDIFPKPNNCQEYFMSKLKALLNDPVRCKKRKPLTSYPNPKELVIFKGECDGWERGVVVRARPPHTCLRMLDIGNIRVVRGLDNMRTPVEEDYEFRPQAMRLVLHNIRASYECSNEAHDYLVNLAAPSEQFYALVRKVNPQLGLIEVDMHTEDLTPINQTLLESGLFEIKDKDAQH